MSLAPDDAHSETGESVASDASTIVQNDDDTEGPADTSAIGRPAASAAPEKIPPLRACERELKQKRTAEFVLGSKAEADIPLIMEYVRHERERLRIFQQIQQRGTVVSGQ